MKHLTLHPSLDTFNGKKNDLIKPHVAFIKDGEKLILAYSKAGSDFTAHEQGNPAFVELGDSNLDQDVTFKVYVDGVEQTMPIQFTEGTSFDIVASRALTPKEWCNIKSFVDDYELKPNFTLHDYYTDGFWCTSFGYDIYTDDIKNLRPTSQIHTNVMFDCTLNKLELASASLPLHGGIVVEYKDTEKPLGNGSLYNALESVYVNGQLYNIDNFELHETSLSGENIIESFGFAIGTHINDITVEYIIGDSIFNDFWLDGSNATAWRVPEKNSIQKFINTHLVDLGLPSGKLWMNANLGANGDDTIAGDYYQWGSLVPSTNKFCDWNTAPFNKGASTFDSSLFSHAKDDFTIEDKLIPNYDAVFQNTSVAFMPTIEDIDELLDNTKFSAKNINGKNYFTLTSKVNGNSISFLATSLKYQNGYNGEEDDLFILSSTVPTLEFADFGLFVNGMRTSKGFDPHHTEISRCLASALRGVL